MFVGLLSLTFCSLFAGGAAVISIAEHPARLNLDNRNALAEFVPSYKRAAVFQGSIALAAGVTGLIAWWNSSYGSVSNSISSSPPVAFSLPFGLPPSSLFLFGGLSMLANWPFTLFAIMPVNRQLLKLENEIKHAKDQQAKDQNLSVSAARPLLIKWGNLHAVRSALGIFGTSMLIGAVFLHR